MTIAVCICTFNRPELLRQCLEAVAAADTRSLGRPVSLIVVDNGPDPATEAVCKGFAARPGTAPLRYVVEPQRGISFARNRAVAEALAGGADLVAFIDDDDRPEPAWLKELVAAQTATGADVVYGCWALPDGTSLPGWCRDIGFLKAPRLDRPNRYGMPRGTASCNVLISRALLERLAAMGPVFDPAFARCGGSDTDLFVRIHKLGVPHATAPRSRVVRGFEPARLTLAGVLRRSFRLGHAFALINARHAPEGAGSPGAALGRLALLVAGLPLRAWPRHRLVSRLARIAREAGGINARLGRSLGYYGDKRP